MFPPTAVSEAHFSEPRLHLRLETTHSPTVNDFANLLAESMRRPLSEGSWRPRRLHMRGNPRWKELVPQLKEVGIEVGVQSELPQINDAYNEFVRDQKEARSADKIKPTAEQEAVEKMFPAIAQWVQDGHVEIGEQEGFGFVVRALDYGGLVFEDDKPETLAEAMAALEAGLRKWFKEQGIEVESADRRQGEKELKRHA